MQEYEWVLPRNTGLGELRMVDVFVYYDGPQIIACCDRQGRTYLASAVERDEDEDVWHYVLLSDRQWEELRRDRISLREATLNPDGACAYRVTLSHGDAQDSVEPISPEQTPEGWLPPEGVYLELSTAARVEDANLDEITRPHQFSVRSEGSLTATLKEVIRTGFVLDSPNAMGGVCFSTSYQGRPGQTMMGNYPFLSFGTDITDPKSLTSEVDQLA